jgi:hypothetical protein
MPVVRRNFEVLKRPQPSGTAPNTARGSASPQAERRRCPRWKAYVPVFVYGHSLDQLPFYEQAYSASVSDLGALLILTTAVPAGEKLLLTNKITQAEQECRVARVGRRDGPSVEIAVEFTGVAPDFWRVTAPPRRANPVLIASHQRETR